MSVPMIPAAAEKSAACSIVSGSPDCSTALFPAADETVALPLLRGGPVAEQRGLAGGAGAFGLDGVADPLPDPAVALRGTPRPRTACQGDDRDHAAQNDRGRVHARPSSRSADGRRAGLRGGLPPGLGRGRRLEQRSSSGYPRLPGPPEQCGRLPVAQNCPSLRRSAVRPVCS